MRFARRRRRTGWARYVGLGLTALVVLVLATALGLWRYADARIDRVDLPALDHNPSDDAGGVDAVIQGTLNVLVVGTDSREGLSDEELEALGTEAVEGNRTDTIMIVQISPARERVVLLSFPRDLRIGIPGFGEGKINSVYGRGGPDLLIQTVQRHTGINLDHYVEVSIAGFLRLADAVGGVEVCLEEPLQDRYAGVDLPSGCQELDKVQAAGFVRARRNSTEQFGANDFGRIARQQYFVKQAMKKVTSAGTLLNPFKVKGLIDVVADSVTTDRDLGGAEMLRLANALKDVDADQLELRTVPSYAGPSFVYEYPEQAESLYQALRLGTPLPAVGQTLPEELTAADVRVQVLNGAGTEGLGSQTEDRLRSLGFDVVAVGNADTFDYTTTVVQYATGKQDHAELLREVFPDAEFREAGTLPDGVDVSVIVGEDQVSPPGA